ncbi:MAG: uracil-DNA glycosylase [Halobacteriota archaeon]
MDASRDDLTELREEIRGCKRCRLSESRTKAAPNQGDVDADVLVVGKMVGYADDEVGLPYQGEAGRHLDYALEANGASRDDVFLTNLTRCHPPESRDPRSDELDRCAPYFERELAIVSPSYVVALGRLVARRLLGQDVDVETARGELHPYNTLTYTGEVLVTYNVGAAMYDRSKRESIADDLSLVL